MSSAVYFIQNETSQAIKIGYASNVQSRYRQLKTASSEPLSLLGATAGGPDLERQLHREFSDLRLKGEWFRPTPELLDRIAAMTASDELADIIQKQRKSENEYVVAASRWLGRMNEYEGLTWGELSKRTGLGIGTLENIKRGRVQTITVDDFEKIRRAYMDSAAQELARLNEQLASLKAAGKPPINLGEIEGYLAKARFLLEGRAA